MLTLLHLFYACYFAFATGLFIISARRDPVRVAVATEIVHSGSARTFGLCPSFYMRLARMRSTRCGLSSARVLEVDARPCLCPFGALLSQTPPPSVPSAVDFIHKFSLSVWTRPLKSDLKLSAFLAPCEVCYARCVPYQTRSVQMIVALLRQNAQVAAQITCINDSLFTCTYSGSMSLARCRFL